MNSVSRFTSFISSLYLKNPLQKKAIQSFLNSRDKYYWEQADHFAVQMSAFLEKQKLSKEFIVDSYLKLCRDMLVEQVKFRKTGSYSLKTAAEAESKIYSSQEEMTSYIYGLALSCFLWPNHYAMYEYFISESKKLNGVNTYLEIGPGHGLYLVESIKNFPHAKFNAFDISPISINISREIVASFTDNTSCDFRIQDVNSFEGDTYDYIVMCEVIEHLDDPLPILTKLRNLLSDNGRLFLTTCANCPAKDHVYHYDSVEHIRREIQEAGFGILTDLPLAVGDFHESEWAQNKVEVNYAAMLQKV